MSRVPMKDATCRTCGHPGKSNYPEHYQCNSCYYRARAEYNLRQADVLVARAEKLRAEVARFSQKALEFEQSGKWHPSKKRKSVGERPPGLWDKR
jgi:tRNA(Ile2) C34 agmatinyltransferase TiaS